MTAIIFAIQAEANAYAGKVDVAYGYPKAGVNIGGGVHVPAALSRTERHDIVLEKSTKDAWAYRTDGGVTAKEPVPAGKSVVTLDSSWDTATKLEPAGAPK